MTCGRPYYIEEDLGDSRGVCVGREGSEVNYLGEQVYKHNDGIVTGLCERELRNKVH
jgi:hypothetical protein